MRGINSKQVHTPTLSRESRKLQFTIKSIFFFKLDKMMLNAFLMSLSLLLLLVMSAPQSSEAAKEPLCTYRNSEGETIFLTYMSLLRKGEDYVDFGTDGKCLKRAICTDTFKTVVEDCAQQKVTCHNKQRYTGVFPACCIKCK